MFEYRGSIDTDGAVHAEGSAPVHLEEGWTPEHLLLAAIAKCTIKSLRFFAPDAHVEASAQMLGRVTRREEDGLYALVEAQIDFEATMDPAPGEAELTRLVARAERGCFVGNSLAAHPRYTWRVNGVEVVPATA